ncbi:MAG: hypothetical protein JJE04_00950 [Acidobacteriia bacterium]|nr:hypothetical protein [Terriglobia bacterium]
MTNSMGLLLVALSHCIGWAVRGNWGHENGAMIPGALSALALVACSGRANWMRRAAWFGFFGALGWSFGGSMSYGIVIGYTKSGVGATVAYGLAMLFVIGFLWGAVGGAAVAMTASFEDRRLRDFFPPLIVVFCVWAVWEWLEMGGPNWFDSDWVGVGLLLLSVSGHCLWKRSVSDAARLMLRMGVGWFAGMLVLVQVMGLHMTPPRSDNWAGSVGMAAAMLAWFWRRGELEIVRVSLITALFSGAGFALGDLFQVLGPSTGITTNWWSLMEQSFGFIAGAGLWIAMRPLMGAERREEEGMDWSHGFAVWFLLVVMTYVNIRKNVTTAWLKNQVMPEAWWGLSADAWFHVAYFLLALTVTALVVRHWRSALAVVPASWLGRTQALYVVVLWWIVLGNLSRVLPFPPARMVTEGFVLVYACVCTVGVLWVSESRPVPGAGASCRGGPVGR